MHDIDCLLGTRTPVEVSSCVNVYYVINLTFPYVKTIFNYTNKDIVI